MKKILLFCTLALAVTFCSAQISDFDSNDGLTLSLSNVTALTGSTGFPSTGISSYGNPMSGNGGVVNNGTGTITTAVIATVETKQFSFDLASLAGTSGNGADGSDEVIVEISTDGGSTFASQIEIEGNGNAQWTYTAGGGSASEAYVSSGGPTIVSPGGGGIRDDDGDGIAKVTVTDIPSGNIQIKITLMNNSGNEYWAVDNLELGTSTASCGVTALDAGTLVCQSNMAGDDNDGVSVEVRWTGSDPDAVITLVTPMGGSFTADPITTVDGKITITGLMEGDDWEVSITGGTNSCNLSSSGSIPSNECNPIPTISDVRINEVDSSPAEDEFIELFGTPGLSLSGLVVVLFNGNATDDASYDAFDLDGHVLDVNGYFIIGKASAMPMGVAAPEIILSGSIQDGTDAVGLYQADATDFPNNTPVSGTSLIDACVYASGDPDDATLRNTLNFTAANNHADLPINEAGNGARATQSVQRGSWNVLDRTPRAFNALPVELLSFSADKSDYKISLSWETASEINNDKFVVEQSADGISFETIAEVSGAGTTHEKQSYEFMVKKPFNGMNYFRLKQVDYDGKHAFSSVRSVNMKGSIGDNGFILSPNPVKDILSIDRGVNGTGTLSVYSAQGQVMLQNIQIEAGYTLDLSTWTAGTYFFQIKGIDGLVENKRIVVMP